MERTNVAPRYSRSVEMGRRTSKCRSQPWFIWRSVVFLDLLAAVQASDQPDVAAMDRGTKA
jgi:hypothetical protein